jgi:N6-L-threonylcarbamoyladenine synthase
MLVLGVESTCDETSAAIVRSGKEIVSHVIFSQADQHDVFGGVVPELASRFHIETIIPVISQAIAEAKVLLEEIDLVAVASGPGLIGSLLVGMQTAKAMAWAMDRPLIGVNHVEAHLYAALMNCEHLEKHLPALGVVLSGGHSTMLLIEDVGVYHLIGQTVDDAVGEAFDKVAKMLKLGYPGGPHVEQRARQGNPLAFPFQAGRVKGSKHSFSFSGLKTAVLYTIQNLEKNEPLSSQQIADLCASFQHAAFSDLNKKIRSACSVHSPKAIFLGGGVTRNARLREVIQSHIDLPLFWPEPQLCLDNAAMIAGLGYHTWLREQRDERLTLEPQTRISW